MPGPISRDDPDVKQWRAAQQALSTPPPAAAAPAAIESAAVTVLENKITVRPPLKLARRAVP
jgi:hypothetical protein